ncbi:MAG: class I SAM-dependent methyltransferase, partial [Spirochaetes bacterium]|nr:class I SAM-dependent methyltransferase [Spirochaetota bacterium]
TMKIAKRTAFIKAKNMLEFGGGDLARIFALASAFPDKVFYSIDFEYSKNATNNVIKYADLKNVNIIKADARNNVFKDNSFDFVYCTGVVEHILDINKAIKEIVRVSKECILIDTPTWKWECYHFLRFWLWVLTHPVYVFHRTIEKMKVENASIGSLAKTSWNKAHVNKWSVSKWRKTFQENGITIISEYTINLGMTYIILGVKVPK